MADTNENKEADDNAERIKTVEQNEPRPRGNVHSEESDEPEIDLPPPYPK